MNAIEPEATGVTDQASTYSPRHAGRAAADSTSRILSPMSNGPTSTRRARSYPAAAAILSERDPVLRRLITEAGPPRGGPPPATPFAALVRAVVCPHLAAAPPPPLPRPL